MLAFDTLNRWRSVLLRHYFWDKEVLSRYLGTHFNISYKPWTLIGKNLCTYSGTIGVFCSRHATSCDNPTSIRSENKILKHKISRYADATSRLIPEGETRAPKYDELYSLEMARVEQLPVTMKELAREKKWWKYWTAYKRER